MKTDPTEELTKAINGVFDVLSCDNGLVLMEKPIVTGPINGVYQISYHFTIYPEDTCLDLKE